MEQPKTSGVGTTTTDGNRSTAALLIASCYTLTFFTAANGPAGLWASFKALLGSGTGGNVVSKAGTLDALGLEFLGVSNSRARRIAFTG